MPPFGPDQPRSFAGADGAAYGADDRHALERLRAKYATLHALRTAHSRQGAKLATAAEDANASDDANATDRRALRAELAALAAEFPGALRELDELPMADIEARLTALDDVACGRAASAPWMHAVVRFHALARGALAAKRWLRGRKRVTAADRDAYAAATSTMPFADDARAWTLNLAEVAMPRGGRVLGLVFARLASELGLSDADAHALVFAHARVRRFGRASPTP
jgi:hypothetical protein